MTEYQVNLLILVLVVGGVMTAYVAAWRSRRGRVKKTASSTLLIIYGFAALFCALLSLAGLYDLSVRNGPPAWIVVSASGLAFAAAVYLGRLALMSGSDHKQ